MGIFRQKCVKTPVFARVCQKGTSKNLLRGRICQFQSSPYTGYVSAPHCQLHPLVTVFRSSQNTRPCRGSTRCAEDAKLDPGRSLSSKALVGDRGSTRCAEDAKLGPGLRRGSTRCASAGFTLLEILVAFTLLALAMGIIMQIFSRGVNGADLADRYAKAAMLAESKLAAIGIEEVLAEGSYNGQFDDNFAWTMSVRAYISAAEPATLSTLETNALANAQATGVGGTIASTLTPTAASTTLGNVDIDALMFVRLYEVELSVAFTTDDGRQRMVTLNTMKIGPRI